MVKFLILDFFGYKFFYYLKLNINNNMYQSNIFIVVLIEIANFIDLYLNFGFN